MKRTKRKIVTKAKRDKILPFLRTDTYTPVKRGPGQPPHKPNQATREMVENLSAVGYAAEDIAECLGLSEITLKKYYNYEFCFATMKMLGLARAGLADALRRKQAWAICFTFKTRGKHLGWSERQEITGANGKDLIPELDMSKLSDEQLKQIADSQETIARVTAEVASGSGDQTESSGERKTKARS